MSYREVLEAHLASYRVDVLGVPEAGTFTYRGRRVVREHILPHRNADLNLLPLVRPLERVLPESVKRHRYFHHLNSSQAFTFNLFLPYFAGTPEAQRVLLGAFGQKGPLTSWALEAVPSATEGSNLDALWTTADGVTTICEVKLSESSFGKAKNDERHRTKLAEIYLPVLSRCVTPELLEEAPFFEAYQILRNVWHLVQRPSARLVFLMPRANEKLWGALTPILAEIKPACRSSISTIAVEDVLNLLCAADDVSEPLRLHASAMSAKYLPSGGPPPGPRRYSGN